MRFTPVFFLFSLFFAFALNSVSAQETNAFAIKPQLSKLPSGMNAIAMPVLGADKAEVTLSLKTGSVYENDSVSGINNAVASIIAERINIYLKRSNHPINSNNTAFTLYTQPEHTLFKFTCSESHIPLCLTLLRDSVFTATFSQPEIDTILARIKGEIKRNDSIPLKVFEANLLKEIFRKDFEKVNPIGNPDEFPRINLATLLKHYKRYYIGNNANVIVTGKVTLASFNDIFLSTFGTLPTSDFDPETIIKIVDFHPMIYNNQFIVNANVPNPEFQICWQFPGTTSHQQGAYCAFLFASILNDKNNYLHVLANKMGCRKFEVRYEPSSFSGIFRIIIQPDTNKLQSTYDWLRFELSRIHSTLINESMVNAGKLLFKKDYEAIKKTKQYPEWIVKFWPFKDERFFIDVADSVMDINEREMKRFVSEYMIENANVTGLLINEADRQALNVDSFFTDVTETVGDYTFTYRPNITNLEGGDNQTKLRNLTQWLKANQDIQVTINGFSDRSEYNSIKDDTVLHFIDSIPTFRKTMPDIFKKGSFRPEMLRSLKIIKHLADSGVSLDRLSGTSMSTKSEDAKDELGNMKCTLRFVKMRRIVSLKEYHYGTNKR